MRFSTRNIHISTIVFRVILYDLVDGNAIMVEFRNYKEFATKILIYFSTGEI